MKKLLALILTLSLLMGMAVFARAEETLPDHPVDIELWTDFTIDEAIMQKAVDDFNAAYADKGYTVTLNKFAGSQRTTLINGAIENDTLPALLFSAWFTTADYVHQGLVEDITDLIAPVRDDLYDAVYDACVIADKAYMVGMYQSYFGLAYNADIFREAGLDKYITEDANEWARWTMAEFEGDILPTLAKYFEGSEKYPIALFAGDNQADTFTLNWLSSLGGQMWKDGKSNAGADENVIAALEKMISWTENGLTNSDVITRSGTEASPDFRNLNSGVCSCQVSNHTSWLNAMANGSSTQFDLRMATVPAVINGEDTNILANYVYGACVMNNGKADQIAVGKEFLRWLLQGGENLDAINNNAIPCFRSIADASTDPFVPATTKNADLIWDFTGGVPGYVATRSHLFPAIQAAYSGDKTPAQALADYSAEANAIIEEYVENSLVLH
ncbi:MAG: extracellular solute-binding protein [Clostridia bacterium]|nr:extracellular solute-binding protein [Clostridia bacterium]